MRLSRFRRQLCTELAASPNARFVADCILRQIAGCSQTELLLGEAEISQHTAEKCRRIAAQYSAGEPLQYLLGEWEFYGIPFSVGPGVLIPQPDSETLCKRAISELPRGGVIADLCAGSGCLGISVSVNRPDLTVYLAENSEAAFCYLLRNCQRYSQSTLLPRAGDVTDQAFVDSLPLLDGILCNPPYLTERELQEVPPEVSREPKEALYGGKDGLYFYRCIPILWRKRLKTGGRLYLEIGMRQREDVCRLLARQGYRVCDVILDIEHRPRVIVAEKEGIGYGEEEHVEKGI